MSITVTEGANIIFSIEEMVDAQDRYRFTATRPTYRIFVGQLMRSIEAAPFRIRVALGDARGADRKGARKWTASAQTIFDQVVHDAATAYGIFRFMDQPTVEVF